MTIDRRRINGNDLSFTSNGDLIHKEYGKLGHSTNIETWDLIVSRLSFSNERPYLLNLVKGVWDILPLPPLFGAEYILDKKHNRCSSLISLTEPYEENATLCVGAYGVVYIRVNTPRPFHFWNEESVELNNVWALIDTHKEQVKDTSYE